MTTFADSSNLIDVSRDYCTDEERLLPPLVELIDFTTKQQERIEQLALKLASGMRTDARSQRGFSSLLHKFPLSSNEGLALMHLAEALLRIPDDPTAQRFMAEKLAEGDWRGSIAPNDPLSVKTLIWSLAAAKRLSGNRLTLPVVKQAINQIATQFVMGKTISTAMRRAKRHEAQGYRYSYDMLGESARTQCDAERYYQRYLDAINGLKHQKTGNHPITRAGISVKLSALHPRYHYLQHERIVEELVPRLRQLALAAAYANINLTIDAEDAHLLDLSLDCFVRVYRDETLGEWEGLGVAVQAYQKRAPAVIRWLATLAKVHKRHIMVRLVKGAYWDTEIKHAQVAGHSDYPVYTHKAATDIAFLACAQLMLEHPQQIYPQFATHNAYSAAAIIEMAGNKPFEFQRLHGMGEALYDQLIGKIPCRIYAPVGHYPDLLAYLVRRLLENGANTSFVNHIAQEQDLSALIRAPIKAWREHKSQPRSLPLPEKIYGEARLNSRGFNLANPGDALLLRAGLEKHRPILSDDIFIPDGGGRECVLQTNPANRSHHLGYVLHDNAESIEQALRTTAASAQGWSAVTVKERSVLVNQLADLLESHRSELIALCVYEAGKTLEDAIAEVREAVDFCRYYSVQGERLCGTPLGVVLCISPWNFPLAIFIGQVVAGLMAGNAVIAKAAEQTGLLAQRTTQLIYQAGVPHDVMQLLVCPGPLAGKLLVPDLRISAVLFTGSTATAQWLNRTLAARPDAPVPLIAETGGQNAMIVDATALPEQVVVDVIASAFYSAGQRCSALRILCVQEELAPRLMTLLSGAMAQLKIGDPSEPESDIGPVIDERALRNLQAHVDYLEANPERATLLGCCELTDEQVNGTFFAPRLYEIDDLGVMRGEVFGPVLHVYCYTRGEETQLLQKIQASGYGLTFGIQSRRDRWAEALAHGVHAGNIYINRNIVGAVVGVQPFGGIGLSGTGPKAGGPWYLPRLQRPIFSTSLPESGQLLAGPTGESNRLYYRARGAILSLPHEYNDPWRSAIDLILQTGNRLILALPAEEQPAWQNAVTQTFGETVTRQIAWAVCTPEEGDTGLAGILADRELAAVCIASAHPQRLWLSRWLAAREGAICPLLLIESLHAEQLLWEQTLTINTTAIGGDTELLAR